MVVATPAALHSTMAVGRAVGAVDGGHMSGGNGAERGHEGEGDGGYKHSDTYKDYVEWKNKHGRTRTER